jgi:hypothetical protein
LQALAIEEPGGEGEFFPQLFHPLPDQAARGDDQRPPHFVFQDEGSQGQPSLDGLPQARLVTEGK